MRRSLLLSLVLLAMAMAQGEVPEEPTAPDRFGETVDVLVVNIETVVTDRDGNRVTGLTRESFRLLVDGEEVPIGYFTEIRDGRATAALLEAEAETGSPPEASPSEPMATHYLVFVDDFFAIGAHRDLVLEALAEQLGGLGEKDRVALVSYDGSRAAMLLDWTGDPEAIREGLESASERPARGPQRIREARMFEAGSVGGIGDARFDGGIDPSGSAGVTGSFVGPRGGYFTLLEGQIRRLADAAAASLRGSLPPPGRKVALLVAGGWASGPLLQLQSSPIPGVAGREVVNSAEEIRQAGLWYRPLVDTANLLGFTLYPIDAPGAGWGGPDIGSNQTTPGFGSGERNIEFTLKQLAQETGGRPMLNGLRTAALETAIEDTRSYYWIGFNATREGSGSYHDVRVEVVRPGLRVRSRGSFVDMSRRAEAERTVEAGLLLGQGEDMGDLEVEFSHLRKGEKYRTVESLLEVWVPFADLELLPVEGRLLAAFEVSLGARDKHHRNTDIFTYPVEMELIEPPPPLARARIPIKVILRRQKHDFVVTVRDSIGGNVFIRRLTFDPKTVRKRSSKAADL